METPIKPAAVGHCPGERKNEVAIDLGHSFDKLAGMQAAIMAEIKWLGMDMNPEQVEAMITACNAVTAAGEAVNKAREALTKE